MLVTLTSGVVTTIAQCSVTKVAAKDVWNLDIRDGDGISLANVLLFTHSGQPWESVTAFLYLA